uniref:Arylacetamide deacetylase-like 4 n=1 Tax=Astyanax mexicanus TaxID=7994 RepID=A0A8B9JHK5_ASTMX
MYSVGFTRWCRERAVGKPQPISPGLRIKDMMFGGVPVRVYEPTAPSDQKRRGMMYFHGGGWMMGSISKTQKQKLVIIEMCIKLIYVIFPDSYRLAPEHRFPAHLDDCEAATLHFFSVAEAEFGVDPHRVVLGGDSAGGNLSAALSQRLAKKRTGDVPSPLALVLIYPALQMADFTLPSYLQNQSVPLLYRDKAAYYFLQYLNGDIILLNSDLLLLQVKQQKGYKPVALSNKSPQSSKLTMLHKDGLQSEFSPLLAEDDVLRLTPSTFILTCEYDVLRDDGILFHKRLKDLGVDVTWHHVSDGFHGIVSFFNMGWLTFPAGKRAMNQIVSYIKTL